MQDLLKDVVEGITEIFEMNAVAGYPGRDYSEKESLALVHQALESGKHFDVLSLHKGNAEAIVFRHSDGWGSLSLRWQDCFYEYRLGTEGARVIHCVSPDRELEAMAWLNTELTVEASMFFRVDPELLEEGAPNEGTIAAIKAV